MAGLDLKSPFSRLLAVYILWIAAWIFGGSFFEVYLLNMGMSIKDIFLSECFWFVASMFTIPLASRFKARDSMVVGIGVSIIAMVILLAVPAEPSMSMLFRFVVGLTHIAFWVPFNTLYYEFRKENNAVLGALYYSLSPILSLVLPAIGGLVAASMGYQSLFLLAILSFILTGIAAWMFVENKRYSYDFIGAIRSISGLRSIIFLEGFSAAIIINVTLAIMPLAYVKTPLEFGIFLSVSTLFSIAATIFTARISDKARRRREFLLPVVFCFGLATILTAFANDFMTFFIGLGLVNFFSRIFFPLPLALVVDNSRNILDSMVGREFILNFGRLAGVIAGYIVFLYSGMPAVLLLEGIAMLAYIPIFENRKRKLAKH